jgi:hypothetical protein
VTLGPRSRRRKIDRRNQFERNMDARPIFRGVAIVAFPILWLCDRYLGFAGKAKAFAFGAIILYGAGFALLVAYLIATGRLSGCSGCLEARSART